MTSQGIEETWALLGALVCALGARGDVVTRRRGHAARFVEVMPFGGDLHQALACHVLVELDTAAVAFSEPLRRSLEASRATARPALPVAVASLYEERFCWVLERSARLAQWGSEQGFADDVARCLHGETLPLRQGEPVAVVRLRIG